jgi:hypothetical protein
VSAVVRVVRNISCPSNGYDRSLQDNARASQQVARIDLTFRLIPYVLAFTGVVAKALPAQDHGLHADSSRRVSVGAHAIGIVSHQSPGLAGNALTEAYFTQPTLMAHAGLGQNVLSLQVMLSLEGLTLERGELNPGIVGEGYIDRRHPHTYLHELTATLSHRAFGAMGSFTLGKGFAPFGTDDPMVRPFVKYPINHHLAQILERIVAVGAVQRGPVIVEAGLFNGDEPEGSGDAPNRKRLWDSWAARGTILPAAGTEVQASYAMVRSPEHPEGDGPDDRKWSASARVEDPATRRYALAEWARTDEYVGGARTFSFTSALLEAESAAGRVIVAGRLEVTERADEERLSNPFRTLIGGHDFSILGRSRWTIGTARIAAPIMFDSPNAIVPFIEVAYHAVRETLRPSGFIPEQFYGSDRIWVASIGAKLTFGERHARMGRYGAALPPVRGRRPGASAPTTHQH